MALSLFNPSMALDVTDSLKVTCPAGAFPLGSKGLLNGKGVPLEKRPIVKSGFRQILPNMLQAQKYSTRVEHLSVHN